MIWDAGARSIEVLNGDGWYTVEVEAAVTGVVVGFNTTDTTPHYSDIQYGFQISQGRWRRIRLGTTGSWVSFSGKETFHVARGNGRVYLSVGTAAPSEQGSAPFLLPGTLVHTFDSAPVGAVFLDSSILIPFDSVFDLTRTVAPSWGVVDGSFLAPTGLTFAGTFDPYVDGSFLPMTGQATVEATSRVSGSFEPMWGWSGTTPSAVVVGSFLPPTGFVSTGSAEVEFARVNGTFPPLVGAASGYEWFPSSVDGYFLEPTGKAYAGNICVVEGRFPFMVGFSDAVSEPATNRFFGFLPAVTHNIDSAFDGITSAGDADSAYIIVSDPEFESLGLADSTPYPGTESEIEAVSDAYGFSETLPSEGVLITSEAEGVSEVEILGADEWVSYAVADTEIELLVDTERELTSDGVASSAVFIEQGLELESVADGASEYNLRVELELESVGEADTELTLIGDGDGDVTSVGVADAEYWLETETDIVTTSMAHATSHYFIKNPGAVAWVMNTETAAPSWYSNWQFVDMVQLADRVLAVGPEGLVEMGADSDAGNEIDAELEYGFTDFGAEQKKRIDAFWFGYTSSDVVEVEVETIDGPGYSYRMQARDADSPRNNRVRPAKGLNARYWRIKVRNTDGADVAVDSISADVVPSARRL